MKTAVKIFNHIEEYTLGLSLLALAIYSCIQVFTRYVLNYSFTSYEEVARYACIFLTFLGASLGIKYSTHFAMTALTDRLPPRFQNIASVLVWLFSAIFFLVVSYYGVIQCLKQFRFGTLTPALRIPMYVPFLPIPIFFFIMGIRSVIKSGFAAKHVLKNESEARREAGTKAERT